MVLDIKKLNKNAWLIQPFALNILIKATSGMILLRPAFNVSIIAPHVLQKLPALLVLKIIT